MLGEIVNCHWQHAKDDYDISGCLSVAMAVEVDLRLTCVNLLVSWGWPFWEYRQDQSPHQDPWHWHSAQWQCHWKKSPQTDKGDWTSCRWPVQCRGEALSRNKGCRTQLSYRQAENMALREPEKEGERALRGLQLTQPKLGQGKTENQHSLEPQRANIGPWQWVERVGNTKEVVGRWKNKSCYRPMHLNMMPWCLHVCIPRVRWLTEMRKKTMQLREKPLVYPRYPKTQTLH